MEISQNFVAFSEYMNFIDVIEYDRRNQFFSVQCTVQLNEPELRCIRVLSNGGKTILSHGESSHIIFLHPDALRSEFRDHEIGWYPFIFIIDLEQKLRI